MLAVQKNEIDRQYFFLKVTEGCFVNFIDACRFSLVVYCVYVGSKFKDIIIIPPVLNRWVAGFQVRKWRDLAFYLDLK